MTTAMKHFLATLIIATLCAVSGYGQTLKALMYNTTNGQVVYSGTNILLFPTTVIVEQLSAQNGISVGTESITFASTNGAATTRTNLGLGATWLTNTNVTNFRTAIGLGNTNEPAFESVFAQQLSAPLIQALSGTNSTALAPTGVEFAGVAAAATRTNLGLGATWLTNTNAANFRTAIFAADSISSGVGVADKAYGLWDNPNGEYALTINDSDVFLSQPENFRNALALGATNTPAFRGITSSGNIVISNQSATNNGLLFIYRTNNEPFLGLANLIASNNTTLSNETLFRVGVAEAANRSAQFGFRTVRTNNGGEGFATFSVYGYNALMMIGPSDRSRTNTATNAGIEADIWTITPTNRVATLRDTNSGAFTLHQELGWSTDNINTNAPTDTTNAVTWIRVWIGTNSYRIPLHQ